MDPYRARTVARLSGLVVVLLGLGVLLMMQRQLVALRREREAGPALPGGLPRTHWTASSSDPAAAARELLGERAALGGERDLDGDGFPERVAFVPAAPAPPSPTAAASPPADVPPPSAAASPSAPPPASAPHAPAPAAPVSTPASELRLERVVVLSARGGTAWLVLADSARDVVPPAGAAAALYRALEIAPERLRLEAVDVSGRPLGLRVELGWDLAARGFLRSEERALHAP